MCKCIIAGSRNQNSYEMIKKAIKESGFEISEVVSGNANGVDKLGERWAAENNIPVKIFVPDWKNLSAEGAIIKENQYGKYNAKAGMDRNQKMAEYADALIAIDEETPGTSDMIERAEEEGLKVFIYTPQKQYFYEF